MRIVLDLEPFPCNLPPALVAAPIVPTLPKKTKALRGEVNGHVLTGNKKQN